MQATTKTKCPHCPAQLKAKFFNAHVAAAPSGMSAPQSAQLPGYLVVMIRGMSPPFVNRFLSTVKPCA